MKRFFSLLFLFFLSIIFVFNANAQLDERINGTWYWRGDIYIFNNGNFECKSEFGGKTYNIGRGKYKIDDNAIISITIEYCHTNVLDIIASLYYGMSGELSPNWYEYNEALDLAVATFANFNRQEEHTRKYFNMVIKKEMMFMYGFDDKSLVLIKPDGDVYFFVKR